MSNWLARLPGGLPDLLSALSIPQSAPYPFDLTGIVLPVAIVAPLPLTAVATTPVLELPFTAGPLVAPVADTRLADTGAQVAGNYVATFWIYGNEGNTYRLKRRNGADAADIWVQTFFTVVGALAIIQPTQIRIRLNTNERLVIENVAAGGGGITYHSSIWLTLSP